VGGAGVTPAPDGTCGNIVLCLLALLCSVESGLKPFGSHFDAEKSVYLFAKTQASLCSRSRPAEIPDCVASALSDWYTERILKRFTLFTVSIGERVEASHDQVISLFRFGPPDPPHGLCIATPDRGERTTSGGDTVH
jgi:hypothetical protein